jgi:hypothetical protein
LHIHFIKKDQPLKTIVKLTKKELESQQAALLIQQRIDSNTMKMYTADTWKTFEKWGNENGELSPYQQDICFTIAGRIRKNIKFEGLEISNGMKILEIITEKVPELMIVKENLEKAVESKYPKLEINLEVLKQAVLWDKKNKKLKNISFTFLLEMSNEKKPINEQNKKIAGWNIEILQKCGFEYIPEALDA